MYEAFFNLRERPFDLAPNPRFLLLTSTHREALANLHYGFTGRKGLTLLVGEAGAGKTTLVRAALAQWEKSGHLVAHLNNPTLTRDEFIEFLTDSFGLAASASASKTRFLAELTRLVTERHAQGQVTGLLIDEAQSLSPELLEEVRLLVNIETSNDKLFQVILAGQPELAGRLNQPGLRQIKQRVALRCRIAPLDVRDAAAYVAGRIQVAGGVAGQVFTREAVMTVFEHSGGIPRIISVICDNALLAGFAVGRRPVTKDVVEEVCRDFDLERSDEPVAGRDSVLVTPDAGTALTTPATPARAPSRGSAPETGTAAAERKGGGLFEHYMAATKRRFSFF
jgi:general secretion pathway protein A